jgi:hypothetical protein
MLAVFWVMNRRVALLLLVGLSGLSVLLLVAILGFAVGSKQTSTPPQTSTKQRSPIVYPAARKHIRPARIVPEEDFSGLATDASSFGAKAPENLREMQLRAETYERLQRQYLESQTALQRERTRQLELQNQREFWKRIDAESKGPVCRRHREEYCLSCWTVSSGFAK